jgi:hypothetical protein
MSGGASLAEALLGGDLETTRALLALDVTFHSPVTDYHGRGRVAAVLTLVSRVLGPGMPDAVLASPDGETATFFATQVGDRTLDGVLRVRVGDGGEVADITLMARPLSVLLPAVEMLQNAAP